MKRVIAVITVIFLLRCSSVAQDYHAIQGSSHAGSLGVHNNPASIVNTAFPWDITVLGLQATGSTNAVTVYHYSLLSSPAKSEYGFNPGYNRRFIKLAASINLLNTRIALGRKQAIAFGANLRSYTSGSSSAFNFIDTLHSSGDFFKINQGDGIMGADLTGSTWGELYGSYARTIIDNASGRLNVGITAKLSRGLSGGFARMSGGSFVTSIQNNTPVYTVTGGNLLYGYSANYDHWQNGNTASQNLRNFLQYTRVGASFDLGAEWLVKSQGISSFGDDDDYFDYDWKIGLAVLDIGLNQYKYGRESRFFSGVKTNITNTILDRKFDTTITSLRVFNDSLATLMDRSAFSGGKFTISNPARVVLNIDHFIDGAFYINADLSLNIPSPQRDKYLRVKSPGLLTVTPRWETKKLGAYLPIQFNSQNQFWIGGAFKAGPLLLGVHNWANLFSKNKMQNGGGYIAFIIRPGSYTGTRTDRRLDCPK